MMKTLTQKQIRQNTQLLVQAIEKSDLSEVKRLIAVADPKTDNSLALREAALNGQSYVVQLLIPLSDPKAHDSEALMLAARHGHTECVKRLIPVSDPKARDSEALGWAACNGFLDIVKLLLPVSDYLRVLQDLQERDQDTVAFQCCIDDYEALQLKKRLQRKISRCIENKNNRVMRKI